MNSTRIEALESEIVGYQVTVTGLRARVAALEAALSERDSLLLDLWDSYHRDGWEESETFASVMDRLGDWRWNNGYDPCNPPMRPDTRAALAKEARRGE